MHVSCCCCTRCSCKVRLSGLCPCIVNEPWLHSTPLPCTHTTVGTLIHKQSFQMSLNFSAGITVEAVIDIISQQASPSLCQPTLNPPGRVWVMFCCRSQDIRAAATPVRAAVMHHITLYCFTFLIPGFLSLPCHYSVDKCIC